MKKITSIVLSVSMAAGALGMNTAVVHGPLQGSDPIRYE